MIIDTSITMLKAKNLPSYLLAEAVNTAVYVENRTLSRTHSEKTPYAFWHGEKPNVKHLRNFGSTAYVHVPKQFHRKLNANSKRAILAGYQENSENFHLFDPSSSTSIERRHLQRRRKLHYRMFVPANRFGTVRIHSAGIQKFSGSPHRRSSGRG